VKGEKKKRVTGDLSNSTNAHQKTQDTNLTYKFLDLLIKFTLLVNK